MQKEIVNATGLDAIAMALYAKTKEVALVQLPIPDMIIDGEPTGWEMESMKIGDITAEHKERIEDDEQINCYILQQEWHYPHKLVKAMVTGKMDVDDAVYKGECSDAKLLPTDAKYGDIYRCLAGGMVTMRKGVYQAQCDDPLPKSGVAGWVRIGNL